MPNEGDEGYIEEQVTKEVLGFEDKTSGELIFIYSGYRLRMDKAPFMQ